MIVNEFFSISNAIKILLFIENRLPKKYCQWQYSRIRNKSSKFHLLLRSACVMRLVNKAGKNILIFPNVFISHFDGISLGDNISIHPMCYIDGAGTLTIGNDVSIAHGTTIMTTEHKYEDIHEPIRNQGYKFLPVVIEGNVWIGAKATILAGTTIGKGTVIGANAVVTKNCDPDCVYVGIPARKLKERCSNE